MSEQEHTLVAEPAAMDPVELIAALGMSDKLSRRRFEVLPLTGQYAPFTEAQGRGPGETTRPAALADLISSISVIGVLQPVLVEELIAEDGAVTRRLVAGERRLLACKWGASEMADNPHFAGVPAVVCPGPLSDEERRKWQLVENLAREDLKPGELAAALLYERCAMLVVNLLRAGIPVPAHVAGLDDPVARWNALEALRPRTGPASHVGAPWETVLRRLGLQLSERKARQLVEAFRALPAEISSAMDAMSITLATRRSYIKLANGRSEAAVGLWAAVQARRTPQLLPRAIAELTADKTCDPAAALERATTASSAANEARAASVRASLTLVAQTTEPSHEPSDTDNTGGDDVVLAFTTPAALPAGASFDDPDETPTPPVAELDQHLVDAALTALRDLLTGVRAGADLPIYARGSLVLLIDELIAIAHLDEARPRRGDGRGRGRDLAS